MSHRPSRLRGVAATVLAALLVSAALLAAACGDDDTSNGAVGDGVTVRLLTHDSFDVSDEVLDAFMEDTGIRVELLQGGDAGTVVNQAILGRGNPQADVLFGIDSTFLTRALEADLFEAHEAEGIEDVPENLLLDPEHRVTPIDYGDVCLNYDKAFFEESGLAVPQRLEDLVDPAYQDLLVVENPATSSPGLAFLLASIEALGEDGWADWWRALRANGVEVAEGWEDAYYGSFSGGAGSEGTRPLVVSYASSPPVEVVFADPPIEEAPTGVIPDSCYRQVEGAGILRGTEHPEEATKLVDFLLSPTFQADVPLKMFVFPVLPSVELPEVFVKHAVLPDTVFETPASEIDEHRETWIEEWTNLVLR
ncbi:MAG: thiamine ABC transporter substrate-binding protein [Acidimicrobiales bacterium]|nr:thiamine ABC transporter substrate-binding protein [Acidimicrobiales bacterium]